MMGPQPSSPYSFDALVSDLRASGDDLRCVGDVDGSQSRVVIAMHHSVDYEIKPRDFHFVELCLNGQQTGLNKYNRLSTPAACSYRPGAVFFQPADTAGRKRMDGNCTNLSVMIELGVMDCVKAELFHGDPDCIEMLGFNELFVPDVRQALHALYIESLAPSAGGQLARDTAVENLCKAIVQATASGRPKPPPRDRYLTRRELRLALDVLEQEVTSGSGLDYVAGQVGLSTFHFARAFKLTTGQSPHQHLIERRLARVKEALIVTERALTDIALDCGFSSQSHMTTAFRRHVSVTPMRFRKILKNC